MRKPGGYAVIVNPTESIANFDRFRCETLSAGTFESDTYTCIHCNKVVHVKPNVSLDEFGSMCRNCMKMVCPICADGPCIPFEKKLEEMERRDQALRSYGF